MTKITISTQFYELESFCKMVDSMQSPITIQEMTIGDYIVEYHTGTWTVIWNGFEGSGQSLEAALSDRRKNEDEWYALKDIL